MSDTFINIVCIHCGRDPFIAVRLSDRALVDNCKLTSALVVKPGHSDKWYEVPHGIKIYPFVLTKSSDLRCVKIAINKSILVVTGNVSQTIVGMLHKFSKMKKFAQCQRQ